MPLIYGPTEMTNPQPKNFVTPSRTTGVYVQNVSPLALIITSSLGSIELPPWQTATLEMMPNDNMNVSAIPITAVPPALAAYAYVDISYTFQGVTVQGSGLFFPFMTPGGDAVAAGIMGPDGLQVGTSTSNPNGSSLLVQATGSNVQQTQLEAYLANAVNVSGVGAGVPQYTFADAAKVVGYGKRALFINNNANQAVNLQPGLQTTDGLAPVNGDYNVVDAAVTIAARATVILDSNDFKHIDAPTDWMIASYTYATTPTLDGAGTAGSTPELTIILAMMPE